MKGMKNNIKVICLLIGLLYSSQTLAGVTLGTSYNYLEFNDPAFEYKTPEFKPTINIGYNFNLDPLIVGISTNRFLNQSVDRDVISKSNGLRFKNTSKTRADTIHVGYRVKRIVPTLYVTNAQIDKKLSRGGRVLGRTQQSTIFYGLGVNFLCTKNITIGAIYLTPNDEIFLTRGIVTTLTYNF